MLRIPLFYYTEKIRPGKAETGGILFEVRTRNLLLIDCVVNGLRAWFKIAPSLFWDYYIYKYLYNQWLSHDYAKQHAKMKDLLVVKADPFNAACLAI